MAFNINDMRSELVYGGWRPTHFQAIVTNPFRSEADNKAPFMTKAAQLPTLNVGKIVVPYFGRQIFVPGDRTYEEWQTTIINDEDFLVRNALETWSNAMNSFEGNIATRGPEVNNYKSTGIFRAFGKDGRTLREYQLNGLFPLTVQSIEASWEANDQIAEFQVIWSFDNFEIIGSQTGDAGGT